MDDKSERKEELLCLIIEVSRTPNHDPAQLDLLLIQFATEILGWPEPGGWIPDD
jgi:hypothetical protein